MKSEPVENVASQGWAAKLKSGIASSFLMGVWMAPVIAAIIIVLFLVIGKVQFSSIGRSFVMALVYSAAIGTPSAILLSWCSFRWTQQHPRLIVLFRSFILLFTATAGSLAAGLVFEATAILPASEYWLEFRTSYPFCVVISLVIGLSVSAFETMRYRLQATTLELSNRQVEQERAYKLLAEARLSSLESRIHPHFLFNTLNSIAALIPTDPRRAEDTVGKLASLLRFSLNANRNGLVPLSQELKIVRDYLEIEKTRFGSRLRYEISVPETMGGARVPPLALQSLVENSVKHVVSARPQGATIQVIGSNHGDGIHLEVIDDGPGFSLAAITPEHGLGNLIARLDLLFGSNGQVEVHRDRENTVVRLSFPA